VVTASHESEERDWTIYSPLYKTKFSGWSHTDSVLAMVFDQGEGIDILDAIGDGMGVTKGWAATPASGQRLLVECECP
jgi:hypothetical protein